MVGPLDHAKTLGKYYFTIKTCKDEFLFRPCNRVRRGLDSIWFTSTFFSEKIQAKHSTDSSYTIETRIGNDSWDWQKKSIWYLQIRRKTRMTGLFSCSKIFSRTGSTSLTKQMSIAIFHWTWKLIAGMSIFMLSKAIS